MHILGRECGGLQLVSVEEELELGGRMVRLVRFVSRRAGGGKIVMVVEVHLALSTRWKRREGTRIEYRGER